jgi:malate/lactate dehydrogenase
MWSSAQIAGVRVSEALHQTDRGREELRRSIEKESPVCQHLGSYNPTYGVTLSMPSVLGQTGVVQVLEPAMSDEERQSLQRRAETLRTAVARIKDGVIRA